MFRSNYTQMGGCIHACWHSVDSSTGQAYSHRGNQVYLHVFAKPHVTNTCFNSLHPECVPENEWTPRLHGQMQTRLTESTMEWAVLCDPVQFSRQIQRLRRGPTASVFRICGNIAVGNFRSRPIKVFWNVKCCRLIQG